jgi:transposase
LRNASQAFEKPVDNKRELRKVEGEKERLLKKVGQLTLECDFFAKA